MRNYLQINDPDSDVEAQAAKSSLDAADLQLNVYSEAQLEQGVHFQVKQGI